jgi:hypothetical protein
MFHIIGKVYFFTRNFFLPNPQIKLQEIFLEISFTIANNFVKTIFALKSKITSENACMYEKSDEKQN